MIDTARTYGLRAALVMVVLSWLSFFLTRGMNYQVSQFASIGVIVLSLLFIFRAMQAERSGSKRRVSFWQYFFTGAITGLVAAVAMILSTVVFMFTAGGAYGQWAEASAGADRQAVIMNPVEQGIIMFLIVMVISSVMSLIGATIYSSKS